MREWLSGALIPLLARTMIFLIDVGLILPVKRLPQVRLGYRAPLGSLVFGREGSSRSLKLIQRDVDMPMPVRCVTLAAVASGSFGSLNVGNVLLGYLENCMLESFP